VTLFIHAVLGLPLFLLPNDIVCTSFGKIDDADDDDDNKHSMLHLYDILEWPHSRTFLKMLHLATSSLMVKISTFTIVHNVVFTLA